MKPFVFDRWKSNNFLFGEFPIFLSFNLLLVVAVFGIVHCNWVRTTQLSVTHREITFGEVFLKISRPKIC